MNRTPIIVLAGGKGSRLAPLTCHRAKPAVPFAGRYRIIDFVLSNVVNSGYRRVYVLTQFMAHSLIKHLSRNWHLNGIHEFIEVVPAQMRTGPSWYRGTADAVWQNANLLHESRSPHLGVFSNDPFQVKGVLDVGRVFTTAFVAIAVGQRIGGVVGKSLLVQHRADKKDPAAIRSGGARHLPDGSRCAGAPVRADDQDRDE